LYRLYRFIPGGALFCLSPRGRRVPVGRRETLSELERIAYQAAVTPAWLRAYLRQLCVPSPSTLGDEA
jgi:hypothetical protein